MNSIICQLILIAAIVLAVRFSMNKLLGGIMCCLKVNLLVL